MKTPIFPTLDNLAMTVQGGKLATAIQQLKEELEKHNINVVCILHHTKNDVAEILCTNKDPQAILNALDGAANALVDAWREEKINMN